MGRLLVLIAFVAASAVVAVGFAKPTSTEPSSDVAVNAKRVRGRHVRAAVVPLGEDEADEECEEESEEDECESAEVGETREPSCAGPPPPPSVWGDVLDATTRWKAPGTIVKVVGGPRDVDVDNNGQFTLPAPCEDTSMRVVAWAPGCAVAVGPWADVPAGEATRLGTLYLAPAAVLEGVVTDLAGPLETDVYVEVDRVELFDEEGWACAALVDGVSRRKIEPGADGRRATFRFASLPPGRCRVRVVDWRGTPIGPVASVVAPCEGLELTCDSRLAWHEVALAFDVRDAVGRRVQTYSVAVVTEWRRREQQFDVSDPDPSPSEGELGAVPEFQRMTVWTEFPARLEFVDERSGGRAAVDLDADPRRPIHVVLDRECGELGDLAIAGTVRFGGDPLTWRRFLTSWGGQTGRGSRVRIEAEPLASSTGRIRWTHTQPDGTFRIDGLLPGRHRLRAIVEERWDHDAPQPLDATLDVAAGTLDVVVELAAAVRQRVIVLGANGYVPPPYVRRDDQAGLDLSPACVRLDDGFLLTALDPRHSYELLLDGVIDGVWSRRVPVRFSPREAPLTVELELGDEARGRVVRSDGTIVRSGNLWWYSGDDQDVGLAQIGPDGRFRLDGLDPGPFGVEVDALDVRRERIEFDGPRQDLLVVAPVR